MKHFLFKSAAAPLYHGTTVKSAKSIMKQGLIRGPLGERWVTTNFEEAVRWSKAGINLDAQDRKTAVVELIDDGRWEGQSGNAKRYVGDVPPELVKAIHIVKFEKPMYDWQEYSLDYMPPHKTIKIIPNTLK